MAKVKDLICGMTLDSESAAGKSVIDGETIYFCSTGCHRQFEANLDQYRGRTDATARQEPELEAHEPNFTRKFGMIAPKFGSAGSGGLEYERLPEAHDRHR